MFLSSWVIAETAAATSPLESASWAAAVIALSMAIIAAGLYHVGRIRPLKCSAEYEKGLHAENGPIMVIHVKAGSRTRNTQTIRTMVIVKAPGILRRLRRPRRFLDGQPGIPFDHCTLDDTPGGVEIQGHDKKNLEGHLFREDFPYGKDTRLMLATSRDRPVLVKIRPML